MKYTKPKRYWCNFVEDDPDIVADRLKDRVRLSPSVVNDPYAMSLLKVAYTEGREYIGKINHDALKNKKPINVLKAWDSLNIEVHWQLTGYVKDRERNTLPPYPSKELASLITSLEQAPTTAKRMAISSDLQKVLDEGLFDGYFDSMAELEKLAFKEE